MILPKDLQGHEEFLDSSAAGRKRDPLVSANNSNKKGKFFFKIWSTTTSVIPATTYVTNHLITLSISGLCTVPGSIYPIC